VSIFFLGLGPFSNTSPDDPPTPGEPGEDDEETCAARQEELGPDYHCFLDNGTCFCAEVVDATINRPREPGPVEFWFQGELIPWGFNFEPEPPFLWDTDAPPPPPPPPPVRDPGFDNKKSDKAGFDNKGSVKGLGAAVGLGGGGGSVGTTISGGGGATIRFPPRDLRPCQVVSRFLPEKRQFINCDNCDKDNAQLIAAGEVRLRSSPFHTQYVAMCPRGVQYVATAVYAGVCAQYASEICPAESPGVRYRRRAVVVYDVLCSTCAT
jgi:hypothetical protein